MKETRVIEIENRSLLNLRDYLRGATHSLLCVGPMSKNVVDAVVGFANRLKVPMPLIASRRQIESADFGGGYVNSWDTENFSKYVKKLDKGFVHLCRDHGGPWQGDGEADLSTADAMARAKQSYLEDLSCGFDILHLDPSLKDHSINDQVVLDMLFELYAYVCDTARELGRRIEIEVGTEQQSGMFSDARELVSFLKAITNFCEKNSYQKPLFCVVQTGTLVKEMRNVGFTEGRRNEAYDQKYAVDTMEKTVKYLVDIASLNGVFVKEHNGDYLSDGSMALRRKLEIGAVNVAPELGVVESKALVSLCLELGLREELDRMLEIFYNSKKWTKWLSVESRATDLEKAIIAGHYTFSKPEFLAIKERIVHAARGTIAVDDYLVRMISAQVQRMTWNLGYFHNAGLQPASKRIETIRVPSEANHTLSASSPELAAPAESIAAK